MKEKYKNSQKMSIRDFQYYNKKFKLILKTFDEKDLKFVNTLSFTFYFWYEECPELYLDQKYKKRWDENIVDFHLITTLNYNKTLDNVTQNGVFRNFSEIFQLYSIPKTSFKLEFISGVINGVVTTDKDTDMKENIQNWCRQKINFLKFVEIDK